MSARAATATRRKSSPATASSDPGKLHPGIIRSNGGGYFKEGKNTVNLSNLDKVLYPRAGFTKGQIISYYLHVADAILPHLKGRKITRKRYPNGVDEPFFFEKNCPSYAPDFVETSAMETSRREGGLRFCLAENKAALVWLANLAALELHTLLSKGDEIIRPTYMVFDLDPGAPADMLDCIRIAQRMRELLGGMKLQCLAKTSGGKGLHLYVPLNTPVTFDETKSFSHAVAQVLERDDPEHITSVMSKSKRGGKVFVDWSQNDDHKTTVCVYSLRARDYPTVSTPVTWQELESVAKRRDPQSLIFQAGDTLKRISRLGDLFAPVLKMKQKLPKI